jgi:hypothetical protein
MTSTDEAEEIVTRHHRTRAVTDVGRRHVIPQTRRRRHILKPVVNDDGGCGEAHVATAPANAPREREVFTPEAALRLEEGSARWEVCGAREDAMILQKGRRSAAQVLRYRRDGKRARHRVKPCVKHRLRGLLAISPIISRRQTLTTDDR